MVSISLAAGTWHHPSAAQANGLLMRPLPLHHVQYFPYDFVKKSIDNPDHQLI
jgi:hypothetical protein